MHSSKPSNTAAPAAAITPYGINHVVLNVRDMDDSHRFWTEIVGLRQVGELKPSTRLPNPPKMRFYSGERDGKTHHHDVALVENRDLPPPATRTSASTLTAINHVAIALPNQDTWLRQVAFLTERGVRFTRRINHGTTHSVYMRDPNGYEVELLYELPREAWQGDIDAALNWLELLPTEGDGSAP
jgi:catechol 2,3-dioxygenase-like lactoylglutathione lyase family enzyme